MTSIMSLFRNQNHIYNDLVIIRTIKSIQFYYCVNKYKLCHSILIYQCQRLLLLLIRAPTNSVHSQTPLTDTKLLYNSTNQLYQTLLNKLFLLHTGVSRMEIYYCICLQIQIIASASWAETSSAWWIFLFIS